MDQFIYRHQCVLAKDHLFTAELVLNDRDKTLLVRKKHSVAKEALASAVQNELTIRQLLKGCDKVCKLLRVERKGDRVILYQQFMQNRSLKELSAARKGEFSAIECRFFLHTVTECLLKLHSFNVFKKKLRLGHILLDNELRPRLSNFYESEVKVLGLSQEERWTGKEYRNEVQLIGSLARTLLGSREVTPQMTSFLEQSANRERNYSLEEMLIHPFLHNESLIPSRLPQTCLRCPPSQKFEHEYKRLGECNRQIEEQWRAEMSRLTEVELDRGKKVSKAGQESIAKSRILVKDFLDLSNKFGFGYKLTNRNVGFNFNDCTVLLLQTSKKIYLFRNQEKQLNTYSAEGIFDSDQLKKKTLFVNALANELNSGLVLKDSPICEDPVYVSKYVKTKYANILRLSNGAVQALFTDKSQIYIDKELRFYLDRYDKETVFQRGESQPEDLQAKLEYVEKLGKIFTKKKDQPRERQS